MGFVAVFLYEVDPAQAGRFEAVYGPDGEWARFFGGADGYLGTELWRSPGRYLVLDRWRSEAGYEAFLAAHEHEYADRNRAAAGVWRREQVLGRFETG